MMVTVNSESPAEQETSFSPSSDVVVGFVLVVLVPSSAVSVVDAVVLVVVLSCSIVLLSWFVVGLGELEGSGVLNPEQASHESAPGHKLQAAAAQMPSQLKFRQNESAAPTIAWQVASLHPATPLAAKQLLSQISEGWLVVLKVVLCCSEVVLASGVVVAVSKVVLASGVVVVVSKVVLASGVVVVVSEVVLVSGVVVEDSEVVLASGVVVEDEPSETTNETVSLYANSPPSKTSSSTIKV